MGIWRRDDPILPGARIFISSLYRSHLENFRTSGDGPMAKDIAKRVSVILMADGEFRASKLMTEAARQFGEAPLAIKLRELQTLAEIAKEEKPHSDHISRRDRYRRSGNSLQMLPKKPDKRTMNYLGYFPAY